MWYLITAGLKQTWFNAVYYTSRFNYVNYPYSSGPLPNKVQGFMLATG
jgi:hypothetical protein